MAKNAKKQVVKCDVESCKNYDAEGICSLDKVRIGCDCDNDACNCCSNTVCKSFEATNIEEDSSDDLEKEDE